MALCFRGSAHHYIPKAHLVSYIRMVGEKKFFSEVRFQASGEWEASARMTTCDIVMFCDHVVTFEISEVCIEVNLTSTSSLY